MQQLNASGSELSERGWTQAVRAAGPEVAELDGRTAAARLAAVIATAAHAHRGLRRARAQLQVDFAAVLGGLRPAVMLDYVVVPAVAISALVCELAEPGGAALTQYGAALQERPPGCLELGERLHACPEWGCHAVLPLCVLVLRSCYRSRRTFECTCSKGLMATAQLRALEAGRCVHAAGAPLLVGEWGGCCYVLRPDLVLARGASAEHGPRLAAFDADARIGCGHMATCRWATPAETAARQIAKPCLCLSLMFSSQRLLEKRC